MEYCDVSDVTRRLNITGSDYDFEISDFIITVSEWVDRFCHMPAGGFAVATDTTRYFEESAISRSDVQILRIDAPLLSVTTLKNGNGMTLQTNNYRLEPRNEAPKWSIRLLTGYSWIFATDGEIEIAGKWGHSIEVPSPVREATAMFVAWTLKRYQAALQDATANFDLGQLVYSESVPKQVKALLTPYINRARLI